MTDIRAAFRVRIMTALDWGFAAVSMWTIICASFALQGVSLLFRPAILEDIGWYGKYTAIYESNEVTALVIYVLTSHLLLGALYFGARKARGLVPAVSDAAAFAVAALIGLVYLPSFLGVWAIAGVHPEALDPRWFARLAANYADPGSADPGHADGLTNAIIMTKVWLLGLPALGYLYSVFRPIKPYKLIRMV
ncbi:hypothetical protein [Rhizobium sp. BK176]|uniref:hypothetical protein n=1 Tax=Rhizobium sp. BK176 TaxID=2587071 RepID=UPI002168ECD0|nr:hypothetical protein [Rhizobium sp. BK176]MCS4089567.1 hypothetical protein [Rhizobium sp. BK176]